jgi:hypothetical protein
MQRLPIFDPSGCQARGELAASFPTSRQRTCSAAVRKVTFNATFAARVFRSRAAAVRPA